VREQLRQNFTDHRQQPVHRLRQRLNNDDALGRCAVHVNDQAGQPIGFPIDGAPRRGVNRQRVPECERRLCPIAQQRPLIFDIVLSQEPQRDLRGAAPEARTQRAAALAFDADEIAGFGVGRPDVGSIHPRMSIFQSLGAACGYHDYCARHQADSVTVMAGDRTRPARPRTVRAEALY
jgi:hypothetical protein